MTSLRPFANVVATFDPDPRSIRVRAADLERRGSFDRVRTDGDGGWVVGVRALPGGPRPRAGPTLYMTEGQDIAGDDIAALAREAEQGRRDAFRGPTLAAVGGDFGFLHIHDGVATIVRSCGGLVPWYSWTDGARVLLSTTMTDLVRFMPVEPRLDPLVNALWAAGTSRTPGGRTLFADVRALPRGSAVSFASDVAGAPERYWDPRELASRAHRPELEAEHVRRFRRILLDGLKRDLDPGGANLLTLSGGIDSSSIAAVVRGHLGLGLGAWSFLPADDDAYTWSVGFIRDLESEFGFARRWEVRSESDTRLRLIRSGPTTALQVGHPALLDLERVRSEADVSVLVGGEFADDVCGARFTYPDWALAVGLRALLRRPRELPAGWKGPAHWLRHRGRELVGRPILPLPERPPRFIHSDVADTFDEWARARRRDASRDRRPYRFLELRAEDDGWIATNWEVCSLHGVRRSIPCHTRHMLDLAYECHPSEKVGPSTKKLLKRALHDLVPARNLHRPDRGYWKPTDPPLRLDEALRAPHEMLSATLSPDWMAGYGGAVPASEQALLAPLCKLATDVVRIRAG